MAKPMPMISLATARDDGGIDANQIAVKVDHCSAGIARINGGVGLNEVLVIFDAETAAPGGADDAHGGRFADSERIADREDDVPDANLEESPIARVGRPVASIFRTAISVLRIGADELGFEFSLVAELDFDVGRAIDDVVVRKNGAIRRDDDA